MLKSTSLFCKPFVLCFAFSLTALGQGAPDFDALMAAQKEALHSFSMMDGKWEGTATTLSYSGEEQTIRQTERVGSFLNGTVKMVEGRGFDDDGNVAFNALGVISYDPTSETYSMRSYARGMVGDFEIVPSANGFEWSIPAGPSTIKYKATIEDGTWTEVGDRIAPDGKVVRFFEMNLRRVSDYSWTDN